MWITPQHRSLGGIRIMAFNKITKTWQNFVNCETSFGACYIICEKMQNLLSHNIVSHNTQNNHSFADIQEMSQHYNLEEIQKHTHIYKLISCL